MTELYISSNTSAVSLEEVMNASSIYFQHMTASELRECLLKPIYANGDLSLVLLSLLEKSGLEWETVPSGDMVINTCYGEPCVLTTIEIFGEEEV